MSRYVDDRVRAVLRAGLTWLYETEQPPDAIDQHHGHGRCVGDRRYDFAPYGAKARPVVIVCVLKPRVDGAGKVLNPLGGPAEMDAVAEALAELGHLVADRWNGAANHATGSLGMADPAHPSLVAAVDRYRAGCPDHTSPLCGWDGCPWFSTGNKRMVLPAWPAPEGGVITHA